MTGKKPADSITVHDLVNNLIPAIDAKILAAFAPGSSKTQQQEAYLALSNQLINELKQHDVIVITSPMCDFCSPPS